MSLHPDQARTVLAEADLIHDRAAVEAAYDRMAEAIRDDLEGRNPLVLVVMIGGLVPAGGILSRLEFPLQVDYVHATRYRGETRGQELVWLARPQTSLHGRTVLLIDDILDEGHTLAGVIHACIEQGADDVKTAVLVEKHHDRRVPDLHADYVGLSVDDRYVFGAGMDYKNYLRNAPGIFAVKGG